MKKLILIVIAAVFSGPAGFAQRARPSGGVETLSPIDTRGRELATAVTAYPLHAVTVATMFPIGVTPDGIRHLVTVRFFGTGQLDQYGVVLFKQYDGTPLYLPGSPTRRNNFSPPKIARQELIAEYGRKAEFFFSGKDMPFSLGFLQAELLVWPTDKDPADLSTRGLAILESCDSEGALLASTMVTFEPASYKTFTIDAELTHSARTWVALVNPSGQMIKVDFSLRLSKQAFTPSTRGVGIVNPTWAATRTLYPGTGLNISIQDLFGKNLADLSGLSIDGLDVQSSMPVVFNAFRMGDGQVVNVPVYKR